MKYAFALAAVAGLASAAHAGHEQFHKRDAAVKTVTDWTVVTVVDVVTVYGPSPSAAPSSVAAPSSSPQAAPVVSSPSVAPVQTTPVAAPTTQAAAPTTPVAVPTTLQTVTSQAPVATPAAPSSVAVPAPAAQSSAAAPAAPAQSSSAPSTGGSGVGNYGMQAGASLAANCPSNAPCKGDMTTYSPGMGSCGWDDSTGAHASDAVALQAEMFGSLSNSGVNQPSNKLCGKTITITNPATGETAKGTIRDKCPGCSGGAGIDLAPDLMKKVHGGIANDRIPVVWSFDD